MARQTTKKDLIGIISNILKEHPEKEVVVKGYQYKLRNGRYGLKAYSLCYHSEGIFARPWSNANVYWQVDLTKLLKTELQDITGRCMMITHP
jgi:hypothetical protein